MTMQDKIVILAIFSFIFSSIGTSLSATVIINQEYFHKHIININNFIQQKYNYNTDLEPAVINLVAGIVCVILSLAMVFSILLLVGIKKNKPGFILAYFGYGIMLTLFMILSAILELLQFYWPITIATILITGFYIWCLQFVHFVYETMQKQLPLDSDLQILIEAE